MTEDDRHYPPPTPLLDHALLITYEFSYGTFSGNGVLAQSLARSLLDHHNGGCRVTVWCCRPFFEEEEEEDSSSLDDEREQALHTNRDRESRLTVHATRLSRSAGWRRVDADSGWREFTVDNLDDPSRQSLRHAVKSVGAIFVVDWTGAHALRSLLRQDEGPSPPPAPVVHVPPIAYLNFRVYSSGISDADEQHDWYDGMERAALERADVVVALSERDGASLTDILRGNGSTAGAGAESSESKSSSPPTTKGVVVLLPPLRSDMERLALLPPSTLDQDLLPELQERIKDIDVPQQQRCFITCVVRLSPEKDTLRFVTFCRALKDDIRRLGYVPLLAGAPSDPEYARRVKAELREACPEAAIVESFLDSKSLAAIFARTALNFHPSAYDAYGMTIVEAAALGVPSVVASDDRVGATAIVRGGVASIEVPIDNDNSNSNSSKNDGLSERAIELIRAALKDRNYLASIGSKAREAALAWDEAAYGAELLRHVHQFKQKQKPTGSSNS